MIDRQVRKIQNPFSTSYAILNENFYGRQSYLDKFDHILNSSESHDKFLFIEGMKASGKTSLIKSFNQIANDYQWLVLELSTSVPFTELRDKINNIKPDIFNNDDKDLLKTFEKHRIRIKEQLKQSNIDFSKWFRDKIELFMDSNTFNNKGLFISIDVPTETNNWILEELLSALQLVKDDNYPICIAITGTYKTRKRFINCNIISKDNILYLDLLTSEETFEIFRYLFNRIEQISITDEMIYYIMDYAKGHPYLVQSLGYNICNIIEIDYKKDIQNKREKFNITKKIVDDAFSQTLNEYQWYIVKKIINDISNQEQNYLIALNETIDDNGYMWHTEEVAIKMGKNQFQEISTYRRKLVNKNILISDKENIRKLRLSIPYLIENIKQKRYMIQ